MAAAAEQGSSVSADAAPRPFGFDCGQPSLFIGGIPSRMTAPQVVTMVEAISGPGTVHAVHMKYGFCFVDFVFDPEAAPDPSQPNTRLAAKVARELDGTEVRGHVLGVRVQTFENHQKSKRDIKTRRHGTKTRTKGSTADETFPQGGGGGAAAAGGSGVRGREPTSPNTGAERAESKRLSPFTCEAPHTNAGAHSTSRGFPVQSPVHAPTFVPFAGVPQALGPMGPMVAMTVASASSPVVGAGIGLSAPGPAMTMPALFPTTYAVAAQPGSGLVGHMPVLAAPAAAGAQPVMMMPVMVMQVAAQPRVTTQQQLAVESDPEFAPAAVAVVPTPGRISQESVQMKAEGPDPEDGWTCL
eukprot:TRINITY_DN10992_c0_g1_i1.p1 TRINITY_DN10992_c0_g1~~TRINITY_DN10992_c0_g1_i1.p1  ORF type:complete len:382 (+),score=45.95 TRINITY_DN10992_c0_g1_i1:80-1147(+)